MADKTIGILGGMGPEATADCYLRVIRNTVAHCDQEHLPVLIAADPKVPDRTRAILGQGPSPVPVVQAGLAALERAGADFVIIPCISVHFFIEELRRSTALPILSILDAVAEHVAAEHGDVRAGILATTGTIDSGLLQDRLADERIDAVVPTLTEQKRVMAAIYGIKSAGQAADRQPLRREVAAVAAAMVERGAGVILAACTEIPLLLDQASLTVPYVDSLEVLARRAVREAGRQPR